MPRHSVVHLALALSRAHLRARARRAFSRSAAFRLVRITRLSCKTRDGEIRTKSKRRNSENSTAYARPPTTKLPLPRMLERAMLKIDIAVYSQMISPSSVESKRTFGDRVSPHPTLRVTAVDLSTRTSRIVERRTGTWLPRIVRASVLT